MYSYWPSNILPTSSFVMDWVAAKGSWTAFRGHVSSTAPARHPVLLPQEQRQSQLCCCAAAVAGARRARSAAGAAQRRHGSRGAHLLPSVGDQHRDRDHSRDDRASRGYPAEHAARLHISPVHLHWPHSVVRHGWSTEIARLFVDLSSRSKTSSRISHRTTMLRSSTRLIGPAARRCGVLGGYRAQSGRS